MKERKRMGEWSVNHEEWKKGNVYKKGKTTIDSNINK